MELFLPPSPPSPLLNADETPSSVAHLFSKHCLQSAADSMEAAHRARAHSVDGTTTRVRRGLTSTPCHGAPGAPDRLTETVEWWCFG